MPPRLGALLAVVFWGLSFVATKAVVAEVSPTTLIFSRAGIGSVFLCATLALRGQPVLPPRDALGSLALMGFVGVAFHQLLQAHALTLTSAVSAGWLIGLIPVWSAVLAAVVPTSGSGRGRSRGSRWGSRARCWWSPAAGSRGTCSPSRRRG